MRTKSRPNENGFGHVDGEGQIACEVHKDSLLDADLLDSAEIGLAVVTDIRNLFALGPALKPGSLVLLDDCR